MAEGLDKYPAVTVICAGRLTINEAGEALGLRRYSHQSIMIRGHEAITRCLFGRNFIGEPTAVMFRKHDLTSPFRDDLPQLMDMEIWFRLLERGDLLSIEKPLCAIRIHEGQMTHVNTKAGRVISDHIRIFNDYSRKTYVETAPLLITKHKLRMTYRVWMSRKFISNENRRMVLDQHAFSFAYPLMPLLWFAVALKMSIERRIGNLHT